MMHNNLKLSGRLRHAADTIDELGQKLQFRNPETVTWTSEELRAEADNAAMDEADEAAIEELAQAMFNVVVTLNWDDATEWTKQSYRLRAAQLYENGWRRE